MTGAGSGRALLELTDVHVTIGGSHILQGVSLSVPEGGVTALLGRNGVGKTTTVKAALGLVPRQGSVRFGGDDISADRTHAIVRRGIGYVPEDREVFPGLTVAENLRVAERSPEPRYDLVHELFPELLTRRAQRAGTLSGGQQQMLAIGRALLNDNRLLLVDEPTKGLAPAVVTEAAQALERAAQVATVLLVEQELGVVRRLAEWVVVMQDGRVVHAGAATDLFDDPDRLRSLLGVSGSTGRTGGGS